MKSAIISFLLGFVLTMPLKAQDVINTFKLEGVELKECKNGEGKCLVLKGKGKYERMDYPRLKIFINNQLVADTGPLYGITIGDGYSISTNLKKLSDVFECLVVVTAMHHSEGDLFVHEHRINEKNWQLLEGSIELEKVSFLKEGDKKFIRLDFKPFLTNVYWSYPVFRIEMNGKVIAERGMESYTLVNIELVPTELDALPENFELKVILGKHNNKEELVLKYKE